MKWGFRFQGVLMACFHEVDNHSTIVVVSQHLLAGPPWRNIRARDAELKLKLFFVNTLPGIVYYRAVIGGAAN